MARRKNNSINDNMEGVLEPAKELSKYGKEFNVAVASYDDSSTINQVKASCAAPGPSTSMRGNVATTINPVAQFTNIWNLSVAPYAYGSAATYSGGYGWNWGNGGGIMINTAIQLVQAAYTHIPKIRTTLDLLTELCVGDIILKGGTSQSRTFFENWFNKINLFDLQSQYYLEDWRSGNMFFYKLQTTLTKNTVKDFNQAFAGRVMPGQKLTIKYLLLNPAYVGISGLTTWVTPTYYVILNSFTLNAIFSDPSEANQKLIQNVPELREAYKQYKKPNSIPGNMVINLPLNAENVITCFTHRQGYENLVVPPFYGLMNIINNIIELEKLDLQINRQVLRATLLITMGNDELGSPSRTQIQNMQSLFQSESIAQVIVGDYTIKGEWLVPNIGELFDPKKYEHLERALDEGLNNILLGDGKYSSMSSKLDIFIKKLEYHRNAFLNYFLIPEMQNIAGEFGFKDIPVPEYAPLSLKEEATKMRIIAQMAQLGLLTADETMTALESGVLPDRSESIKNQKEYKKDRDEGLFAPMLGKPQENQGGRPGGSSAKQTTQKISPAGTVGASKKASPESLRHTMLAATNLEKKVESWAKKQYNIKKLTKEQNELVGSLVEQIIVNEPKTEWENKLNDYLDFSKKIDNTEIFGEINKLAVNIGQEPYAAALLYHSLFEIEEKE